MNTNKNTIINNNLLYIKEFIDKDKLITKIFNNIESKAKIIEKYKNKYFNSNNILDSIILGKLEFLEILNDFEEIISQSLQGMRSLFAEIRNLKEKVEYDEKILKKRNHKLKHYLNIDKGYSTYMNNSINNNKENEKNNIYINERKDLFYNTYNRFKNNFQKNNYTKLYYKKNTYYKSKASTNSVKNIYNNNIESFSNFNTRNTFNENKYLQKPNKNISVDSIGNKDILTYDLSLNNDFGKEIQIQNYYSTLINNNNINNDDSYKNNNFRKILRLELKKKEMNNNKINTNKKGKNISMSQRYELELENTENTKKEKIEVDIKYPIRQGIKRNCRKRNKEIENSKNEIIDKLFYNYK